MWLFGEIDKFKVIRKRLSRKIECEDTALVSIYFKKKILANLTMTTLVPFKNYEGSITVIGDKGLIKIGGQALNKIVETINIKLTKKHDYKIDDIYGHGHLKVYKEIVKNLTNKNEAVFASEGLKSLKFINQLYSQSKNMRIFITGVLGTKGTALTKKLLEDGYTAVCDTFGFRLFRKHKNLNKIKLNINDIKQKDIEKHDAIIHLASIANDPGSLLNSKLSWETIVLGTYKLCVLAKSVGIRKFIYASSGSVYGFSERKTRTRRLSFRTFIRLQ